MTPKRPKRERVFRRGRDCPWCGRKADRPLADDQSCTKCAKANTEALRARLAPGVDGPDAYRLTRED